MYDCASDFRKVSRKIHPDKGGHDAEAFHSLTAIREKHEAQAKQVRTLEATVSRNQEIIRSHAAEQAHHAQEMEYANNSLGEARRLSSYWCNRAQGAEMNLQHTQTQAQAVTAEMNTAKWRSETKDQALKKEKGRSEELEKRIHILDEKLTKAVEGEKSSAESLVNAREDVEFWSTRAEEFLRAKDEAAFAESARTKAFKERIAALEITADRLRGAPEIVWRRRRGRSRPPEPQRMDISEHSSPSPEVRSVSPVPRRKRARRGPRGPATAPNQERGDVRRQRSQSPRGPTGPPWKRY